MVFLGVIIFTTSVYSQNDFRDPARMLGTDYDLEETFSRSELRRLATEAKGQSEYNRRLWQLILRAGLENDESFMLLLQDQEVRKSSKSVDLAVSAYEYLINGSETSLDHILAALATEPIGADSDTPMILSVLNEWDRTIKAFKKHFHVADGAAAANMDHFHSIRNYLYPDEYSKHKDTFKNPWKGYTNSPH